MGVRRTAFIPGSGANSIASLETLRSRATIKSEYVHSAQARIPWFNERKKNPNLFIFANVFVPVPAHRKKNGWVMMLFSIFDREHQLCARGPMNGSVYHLQTLSPFSSNVYLLMWRKIGGICLLLMPAINHEIYTCYISTNICQLLCYYYYLFLYKVC